MTDYSLAEQAQETLRRISRPETHLSELSYSDWELGLRLARRARLIARVAHQARAQGVMDELPVVVANQLEGAIAVINQRVRQAKWELDRITWALEDEDVPVIALKGCAYMLMGLPNAVGRYFADVDLLVPESALGRIEQALVARGWQTNKLSPYDQHYYRKWTHELPPMTHVERSVEVDLHHAILPRTSRLKPDSRLLLAEARSVDGSRFKVLSPVDMVLHTITHLFYDSEMANAYRDLVDVDDLLRHFGAEDPGFWKRLLPRAVSLNLLRPAFYGLRYSRCILGTPVPQPILTAARRGAPTAPVLWLMDQLVPRALLLDHPDRPSLVSYLCRWLLFVRSHWIRMPPLLLVRHLGYKFYVRHLRHRLRDRKARAQHEM